MHVHCRNAAKLQRLLDPTLVRARETLLEVSASLSQRVGTFRAIQCCHADGIGEAIRRLGDVFHNSPFLVGMPYFPKLCQAFLRESDERRWALALTVRHVVIVRRAQRTGPAARGVVHLGGGDPIRDIVITQRRQEVAELVVLNVAVDEPLGIFLVRELTLRRYTGWELRRGASRSIVGETNPPPLAHPKRFQLWVEEVGGYI